MLAVSPAALVGFAVEHRQKTDSVCRLINCCPCELETGGEEIGHVDQCIGAAARLDHRGPVHDQRNTGAGVVQSAFTALDATTG